MCCLQGADADADVRNGLVTLSTLAQADYHLGLPRHLRDRCGTAVASLLTSQTADKWQGREGNVAFVALWLMEADLLTSAEQ